MHSNTFGVIAREYLTLSMLQTDRMYGRLNTLDINWIVSLSTNYFESTLWITTKMYRTLSRTPSIAFANFSNYSTIPSLLFEPVPLIPNTFATIYLNFDIIYYRLLAGEYPWTTKRGTLHNSFEIYSSKIRFEPHPWTHTLNPLSNMKHVSTIVSSLL